MSRKPRSKLAYSMEAKQQKETQYCYGENQTAHDAPTCGFIWPMIHC